MSAPRRVWRRCCLLRCWEDYPYEVPLDPSHFTGAWDYSGPAYDGMRDWPMGTYATFDKTGRLAYRGGSTPGYELVTL